MPPSERTPQPNHWIPIESADDPRVSLFTGLTDVQLRSIREPAEGVFVAEGATVVRRALATGYEPLAVLASAKWLRLLDADDLIPSTIPHHVASDAMLAAITGYAVHRGVLVLMRRRPLPNVTTLLADARRVVLLDDLKEHANVGAILRCSAAFGIDAVITSPSCADPLYRRSVKVSMGTVFQVPWTTSRDWSQTLDEVHAAGFVLAALTPNPDATDLRVWAADAPDRVALLFGTEGPGLSPATLDRCDVRVRIPMSGGVDSLNVGAAAAVALYALQP